MDHQKEEGTWFEDEWTGTGFPRVFYLRYHLYRIYWPLMALGRFVRLGGSITTAANELDGADELA